MNKQMWSIQTMVYYSAIKRNEVLTHTTTRTNLENTMLSTRSQTQKVTYCMTPFTWNVHNRQIHRDRTREGAAKWLDSVMPWCKCWCGTKTQVGLKRSTAATSLETLWGPAREPWWRHQLNRKKALFMGSHQDTIRKIGSQLWDTEKVEDGEDRGKHKPHCREQRTHVGSIPQSWPWDRSGVWEQNLMVANSSTLYPTVG